VEVLRPANDLLLFFPDGSWTQVLSMPAAPPAEDTYDLYRVDVPGQALQHMAVQGHLPRTQRIFPSGYLPGAAQVILSSPQGVSLVSVPGGELQHFWSLEGRSNNFTPNAMLSPGGEALAVFVEGTGVYYIPLTP